MTFLQPQPPKRDAAANPRHGKLRIGGFDLLMQELSRDTHGQLSPRARGQHFPSASSRAIPSTSRVLGDATNRLPKPPTGDKPGAAYHPKSAREAAIPASAVASTVAASTPRDSPVGKRTPRDSAPDSARGAPATIGSGEGMSPGEAVGKFQGKLSPFEQREIHQYERVYCAGEGARKIQASPSLQGPNNYGYDDDKGDYRMVAEDHLAYRYQLVQPLGRGSFGQVYKAMDCKTKTPVAVKVIKNKKKFHEQALVEVKVLKHLNDRDPGQKANVIEMLDHFLFRNHMVIVFPLEGMSIYDLLRANRFGPLPEATIRHFGRQLLQALALSAKEHIVHCDLKPENILIKRGEAGPTKTLRVIDWGSSCFDHQRIYTYIQSRFYRAPEILLGIPYTPQIDMWSLGCLLAELANGYPLFPGESEVQQMMLIMETMDAPPKAMLDMAPRKKNFFDSLGCPRIVPNAKGKVHRVASKRLADFIHVPDPEGLFLDLLRGLLTYEPERRLTPAQALRHPYFTGEAKPSASTVLPKIPSGVHRF